MIRIDDYQQLKTRIVNWLKDYYWRYDIKAFVVGVSGGIDSAVVSTLCAETGLPTHVVGMPIHQQIDQEVLSDIHLDWLDDRYKNVTSHKFDLTNLFEVFSITVFIFLV